MDNTKTGNLIREARKEKGLTQLELSEKLHVSDRAVSKWERGLCAPDIALLEPLSEALGLTLTELISGERNSSPDTEAAVKDTISYSRAEISRRGRTDRRKIIAIGLAAAILAAAVCLGFMWYRGFFHIIGRYPSPDGETVTTVYSQIVRRSGAPTEGGFTLRDEGYYRGRTNYLDAEFKGLWWSPDGKKQVVAMSVDGPGWEEVGETFLAINYYERNSGGDLDARLERGIYGVEFFAAVPWDGEHFRRLIEFEFVRWSSADPDKMLVYFRYFDADEAYHEGYLWYDCESGTVSGEMEIEQGEKNTDELLEIWDKIMG